MSRRTMVVVGLNFSALLIAGAAFTYAVAILVSAVNFYSSTQKINVEDVRVLEELPKKHDNVMHKERTTTSAQTQIDQKNKELKAAITDLRQANTESALASQLDTISANLSFLSEILKNEQGKAADVVAQLKTKVT